MIKFPNSREPLNLSLNNQESIQSIKNLNFKETKELNISLGYHNFIYFYSNKINKY